ncbi:4-hydroxy-tetrahydrodipicolinate synthase [Massilibacterium senegalense]|uniref:4-hydroxy-tetrahydrodipicolinate synthase n=1 Tax=Massilibacterium senegalense TaxID=1632858 RepID=UPI0007821A67|nr:4-hydroxy-tetrahydrodipicolinate synthase [Massilibacterium senegalense]
MNFGSVLTAMVTPFDRKGNVDFEATTRLVEYLINNGTEGLVVCGTTGESPTLTTEEKLAMFKHVVSVVNKRVPVIAGTGTNNTKASIDMTKQAESIGVDGIMAVAPYYNKPSQEGLYEHYKAIAESTSLPVMIYNIPGRSSVNIQPKTIIRLAEIENITSVKEASGNLDAFTEIIANTPDDFILYSGDDGLTLPALSIGAVGVISVASHVIGNEMSKMVKLFKEGHLKEAASMHQKLLPVMRTLFIAPSPAPVKAALQMKGLDVGSVRLPIIPLSKEERELVQNTIQPYL